MENIKKLKTENESLRILVQQDSLTGLLNHMAMEDKINQMLKQKVSGIFIMIDMDEFKLINDKYGHLMGDKILQELEETESPEGAYCQDFHTFLSFYRLFERLLGRFSVKCHLILITMAYSDGVFIELDELDIFMDQLRESICFSMRSSDVYTQYSSSQFLIMTPGASQEDMNTITARIDRVFYGKRPDRTDILLSYSYYPLKATTPTTGRGV